MNQFRVQVRLPGASFTYVVMCADSMHQCQQLAESQYGSENVISVSSYYG